MPTAAHLPDTLLRDHLARALDDVFTTMLGYSVQLVAPEGAGPAADPGASVAATTPVGHVVGTVGFVGDADGLIYLYLTEPFALQCTGVLLGLEGPDLADAGAGTVNDAVGELTNMVVGSFKNALGDAGFVCKLTIPSILRGSNFYVEPLRSVRRHVFEFQCRGHRIAVEILLRPED